MENNSNQNQDESHTDNIECTAKNIVKETQHTDKKNNNESMDNDESFGSNNCHESINNEYARITNIVAKLNKICDISEYHNDGYVSIKDMCELENTHDCKLFDQLLEYIESNDTNDIQKKLADIYTVNDQPTVDDQPINISSNDSNAEYRNLITMRVFQRFKGLEHNCLEFREKSKQYNMYQKMYNTCKISAKEIHDYNVSEKQENNNAFDSNQKLELLMKAMTPYKMTQELLTYELLHFCNDPVVKFDEDNCEDISNKIRYDVDRFNPIVQAYLEDRSWTINKKDTLNFSVPKNRIVLSNTIDTTVAKNTIFLTHMDMLVHYIKRCYKISSLKYLIVEDNKYDLTWVLIVIGFYCKK